MPASKTTPFQMRAGQKEFVRGVDLYRVAGLLARRQYGKTTIASRIAFKVMIKTPGESVIFGSVKLDLGREIVRKEADDMQRAFRALSAEASARGAQLQLADAQNRTNKLTLDISADDWAELYEHSRLEFRLYHDKTTYSRTKVVALTPDAVGETGWLILDEVGRAKRFREVIEAMMPIIASNPKYRAIYTTTPPPDDAHPSFDLLAPPLTADLPINPKGNWYKSELGVRVLRITAWDAFADGVPLYDDETGNPISPEQSRAQSHDKDAWDRNYGCRFVLGGTSAVGLLLLDTAQRRGVDRCAFVQATDDSDFEHALRLLNQFLMHGRVGLGWDLATTEGGLSNPSAFAVCEETSAGYRYPLVVTWKTSDPAIAKERARRLVETVALRRAGGPARRLCIDSSNEKYFAADIKQQFRRYLPVVLVAGGEAADVKGHRMDSPEKINMKTFLGNLLIGELEDNHVTLPPERALREDFRRVKRVKGSFETDLGPNGEHGDTFDACKLALHALTSKGGSSTVIPVQLGRPQRIGLS